MQIFDLFSDLHQARMRGRGKRELGKERGGRGGDKRLVCRSEGESRRGKDERERLNGKPFRVPPGVGQRAQIRRGRSVTGIENVDGATGDVQIAW